LTGGSVVLGGDCAAESSGKSIRKVEEALNSVVRDVAAKNDDVCVSKTKCRAADVQTKFSLSTEKQNCLATNSYVLTGGIWRSHA